MYQRRKPADKVYARLRGCTVKGFCNGRIVLRAAGVRHDGDGCDGNALIDDGNAEIPLDIFARMDKIFRRAGDLVVNTLAEAVYILRGTVAQGNAHCNGADIQVLLPDHLDGL